MGKSWQALALLASVCDNGRCCCRTKLTLDEDSRGIGAVAKGDVAQGKDGG